LVIKKKLSGKSVLYDGSQSGPDLTALEQVS